MSTFLDPANTVSSSLKPACSLCSGYIPVTIGDTTAWVFVSAYQFLDDFDADVTVQEHFRTPAVQALLGRLAVTFEEFFHLTADAWEVDFQAATAPVTILTLWRTTADVFDYFTLGKKLPWGARADYFRLILGFFNHPGTCLDGVGFNSLTPGRANRVVAEMGRFFHRHPASGRSVG